MKPAKIFIAFTFLLAFAVQISAQENPFPNELNGFEFFGKGKLKDLRLAVSSKEDVTKIFGKSCEESCDYDTDWSVNFEYYEKILIKESRDEKQRYALDSKYLGTVRTITLRPKKQVSFVNILFPDKFDRLSIALPLDTKLGKGKIMVREVFLDTSGLVYEIYSRTIYDDIKNTKAESYTKGDLVLIRYDIPNTLEKEFFVLQK